MANGKRKEFNIVDELKKDGIGPTSWKDLAEKEETVELIPKQTITLDGSDGQYMCRLQDANLPVPDTDKNAVVVVDGNAHEVDIVYMGSTSFATQPLTLADGAMFYVAWESGSIMIMSSVGGNRTIEVYQETTTITPIPTEYLPEKTVFSFIRGNTTATCNKTFAECVAEYRKGNLDAVAAVVYNASGPSSFLLNITDAVLFEGETEVEAISYGCGGMVAGEFYRISYMSDGSIAVELISL